MSKPLRGKSWNPYSSVHTSLLNYVDPGGFQQGPPPIRLIHVAQGTDRRRW